ncbi:MAG: zinc-dependent metalloprotease, partial [Acidimicrobiales bacterium]
SAPAKLLQQIIGLEAKMRQYALGEAFIAAVESDGPPAALDRAWRGPEWLPTAGEIKDPASWLQRTGALAGIDVSGEDQ